MEVLAQPASGTHSKKRESQSKRVSVLYRRCRGEAVRQNKPRERQLRNRQVGARGNRRRVDGGACYARQIRRKDRSSAPGFVSAQPKIKRSLRLRRIRQVYLENLLLARSWNGCREICNLDSVCLIPAGFFNHFQVVACEREGAHAIRARCVGGLKLFHLRQTDQLRQSEGLRTPAAVIIYDRLQQTAGGETAGIQRKKELVLGKLLEIIKSRLLADMQRQVTADIAGTG